MTKIVTLILSGVFLLSMNIMNAQDTPSTAVPLTVGNSFDDHPLVGSNVNATNSEDTDSSIPSPSCAFYSGGDSWYSIEVPDNGYVTIQTGPSTNGISDTGLNIYEGNTTNLQELACDDDGGSSTFSVVILNGRTPGEILYVRVWEYSNDEFGTYEVSAYTFDNSTSLPNDDVEEAITLPVGNDFLDLFTVGTNIGATPSEIFNPSIPNPSCGLYSGGDVWYKVSIPNSGNIVVNSTFVNFSELGDAAMAIYEGSFDNLSQVDCVDDTEDSLFPLIALTDRTPGEVLYIRYYAYSNNAFGEFTISAYDQDLVDTDNETILEQFSFYPNPVDQSLLLNAHATIQKLAIYNLLGEKLMEQYPSEPSFELDVHQLQKGTYVIEVKVDGITTTNKFIKI